MVFDNSDYRDVTNWTICILGIVISWI